MNPAIMALSETRLTPDIENSDIYVPGYSIVRCDATNRNTGGVMLYVKNDIKHEVVLVKKIESNCWCVAIEVCENLFKGRIMVVYHLLSTSDGGFYKIHGKLNRIIDIERKMYGGGRF